MGATIPTLDTYGNLLEWTVYSFGSDVVPLDRTPLSHLQYAIADFDSQDRVAIRFANERKRFVLVRHAQHGDVLYATRETKGDMKVVQWDTVSKEDRTELFRFVYNDFEQRGHS